MCEVPEVDSKLFLEVLTPESTRLFLNGKLEKYDASLLGFYFVHLLVLQTKHNFQELAISVFR